MGHGRLVIVFGRPVNLMGNLFRFSVASRPQKPSGLLGTKRPKPRTATSTFTQLLSSFVQCCFTSAETIRTVRDGEPRTATSTFTQLLGSAYTCFSVALTSTEPTRLIRDGEPRTATSTFTQLLGSVCVYLFQCCFNVHRNYQAY